MKKFLAIVAFLLPMTLMAQEEKDTTIVIPQSETTIRLAAQLAKYGYQKKDALSLVEAARLSKSAGFQAEERSKYEVEEMRPSPDAQKAGGKITLDPAQLLADAKAMAGDDAVITALVDDVNSNVRGATNGPRYNRTNVAAGGTDTYRINFRGGELAMVTAIGDGDTDLDLYVYDQNGNLIARDADYTDDCVVTFTPRWTGLFIIKVVNRGRVYNNYILRTN